MSHPTSTPDLGNLIRSGGPARRSKLTLFIAGGAVLLILIVGLWLRQRQAARDQPAPFVTEAVQRGDLALTITATGNLEPTNEVTVGSELSGTTLEVYVDTNDRVTKGQPLAKLDTSKLAQQTESSRAAVRSAEAGVELAKATLLESDATLARQEDLNRLSGGKSPARTDLDTARASANRAKANLASAEAALGEAQARLKINESDLAKAIIRSPIDGIVLTRKVEPGQTVAASFTAPELFVIAEKLEHMKLKVTIAEADIGHVAKGHGARFTVDAWPDRTYSAEVTKVAFGSSVSNNVVTYETELQVSNSDLTLRPGMTATADIRVAERKQTLFIPNAAFRFNPDDDAAKGAKGSQSPTFVQRLMPFPRSGAAKQASEPEERASTTPGTARIWILRDSAPIPLDVTTGLNEGRRTEVSGEGVSEGLAVIVRANPAASSK